MPAQAQRQPVLLPRHRLMSPATTPLADSGQRPGQATRSRLVANLYRAGFGPDGSHLKGFGSVDACLHRFPLSQAYPGAQPLSPKAYRERVGKMSLEIEEGAP